MEVLARPCSLQRLSGRTLPHLLHFLPVLGFLGLWLHHSNLGPLAFFAVYVCLSMFSPFIGTSIIGFWAHLDDCILRSLTNCICKYPFPELGYILRFCVAINLGTHYSTQCTPQGQGTQARAFARYLSSLSPARKAILGSSAHTVWLFSLLQKRPSWCLGPTGPGHIPSLTQGRRKELAFPTFPVVG